MTKKKLLILTSTFPGSARDRVSAPFVYRLALELSRYYKIYVLAPHFPGLKTVQKMKKMTVIRFQYFFPARFQLLGSGEGILSDLRGNLLAFLQVPFFFISQLVCFLRIICKEEIRIVNSHWIVPQGFLGALARKFFKVKHVLSVHAAGIFLLKRIGFVGTILGRWIEHNSDAVVPVSRFISKQIELVTHSKVFKHNIISMGVDTGKFTVNEDKTGLRKNLGIPENTFVFLFVGKFAEKKGVDVLLRAFHILKNRGHKACLVLVGGGRLESSLKELVSALKLESEVKFFGWVHNDLLPGVYSACDCLVVPSVFDSKGETEGLPVVIMEAMACGLPVLGSDISGISEIIENGKNGWLFTTGNADEMAQKMQEVISSRRLGEMSKKAVSTAQSYSWEVIGRKYRSVIEGL